DLSSSSTSFLLQAASTVTQIWFSSFEFPNFRRVPPEGYRHRCSLPWSKPGTIVSPEEVPPCSSSLVAAEIRRQGRRSSKRRRKGKLRWWTVLCFVKVKKVSCALHSCLRC
ncbi:hypothetical protein V2J09_004649, partial [Rumex salicifolius]